MQICNEITKSERDAIVRHFKDISCKLPDELLNKMIIRYENKVANMEREVQTMKFELDDRELAVRLYFDGKLSEQNLKELINYE